MTSVCVRLIFIFYVIFHHVLGFYYVLITSY